MTTSPPAAPPPTVPADPRTLPGAAAGPTAAPEGPDSGGTGPGASRRDVLARRIGFAGPVLAALVLNCWRLSGNGLGNTYYAAAVRSMGQSWR